MKKKKNIIIEIVILITIIASVFIVYYIYKKLSDVIPEASDSYKVINYSQDKYLKLKKDLNELSIYKIPEFDKIIVDNSKYDYYLTSTDNYINTITEIIEIRYDKSFPEFNENQIINFCNGYDDIQNNFILKCNYKESILNIRNVYYLSKNYQDTIKTRKYNIKITVPNNTKLNEFEEKLKKEHINYEYVRDIK